MFYGFRAAEPQICHKACFVHMNSILLMLWYSSGFIELTWAHLGNREATTVPHRHRLAGGEGRSSPLAALIIIILFCLRDRKFDPLNIDEKSPKLARSAGPAKNSIIFTNYKKPIQNGATAPPRVTPLWEVGKVKFVVDERGLHQWMRHIGPNKKLYYAVARQPTGRRPFWKNHEGALFPHLELWNTRPRVFNSVTLLTLLHDLHKWDLKSYPKKSHNVDGVAVAMSRIWRSFLVLANT